MKNGRSRLVIYRFLPVSICFTLSAAFHSTTETSNSCFSGLRKNCPPFFFTRLRTLDRPIPAPSCLVENTVSPENGSSPSQWFLTVNRRLPFVILEYTIRVSSGTFSDASMAFSRRLPKRIPRFQLSGFSLDGRVTFNCRGIPFCTATC